MRRKASGGADDWVVSHSSDADGTRKEFLASPSGGAKSIWVEKLFSQELRAKKAKQACDDAAAAEAAAAAAAAAAQIVDAAAVTISSAPPNPPSSPAPSAPAEVPPVEAPLKEQPAAEALPGATDAAADLPPQAPEGGAGEAAVEAGE